MRLTYPQAPPEILQLAYGALNLEMLRHPHSEHPSSLTSRSNAFGHVPELHKVFLVTPADIANRQDLRAAKHTSWYDVVVLSGVSHGIEVAMEAKQSTRYVTRGSTVDHELSILTALIREPEEGAFEVRVLRIPLLVPFSFWLKAVNDRHSVLVPVVSNVQQLQPGKKYEAKEFFDVLRKTAAHLITTNLAPAPPRRRVSSAKASKKLIRNKKRAAVKTVSKR